MSRRLQGLLGLACLALAVAVHPAPPSAADGVLAAVGRSMGGSRVMVIDALFLRAESQRNRGHVDDAAALYRTALDLDPANEAATIFLVNVYVDELIPQLPAGEPRYLWWTEARALLDRALRRTPQAPSLHARAAGLVLEARRAGGLLDGRPAAERRALLREALAHLRAAVAGAATLPRLGRIHLVQVALLAPELAAEGLRRGDRDLLAFALTVGDEALEKRGDVLAELRREDDGPGLAGVLRAGLAAVRAVQAGAGEEARRALEVCRQLVPRWSVPGILEEVLDR